MNSGVPFCRIFCGDNPVLSENQRDKILVKNGLCKWFNLNKLQSAPDNHYYVNSRIISYKNFPRFYISG